VEESPGAEVACQSLAPSDAGSGEASSAGCQILVKRGKLTQTQQFLRCRLSTIPCGVVLLTLMVFTSANADEADAAQAARDRVVVETLRRLPSFDLKSSPPTKAALLRHLRAHPDSDGYLQLIERFELRELDGELLATVIARPDDTAGVGAARLLLKFGATVIHEALNDEDGAATAMAAALGRTNEPAAIELLKPLVVDTDRSAAVRMTATQAVGAGLAGQRWLLERFEQDEIPRDVHFVVASALHRSVDADVQEAARRLMPLPPAVGQEPLPPLGNLVQRRGDVVRGATAFRTTAACAKCHKVHGEGKEVGPDLSEIGSKLSREALYVGVVDPSAGINHGYESYAIVLEDGNVLTGILVSETERSITIKNAEAIVQEFSRDQIDEMVRQSVSLMPADLTKIMTVEQLVDVVEYMTTLKKE